VPGARRSNKFKTPPTFPPDTLVMKQCKSLSHWLVVALFGLATLLVSPVPLHASTHAGSSKEFEALLERARKAAGGNAWGRVSALTFSGTENRSGMQEIFTL